jgi:hypothetical protein
MMIISSRRECRVFYFLLKCGHSMSDYPALL